MNVILISTIRPERTTAAALTLHRHLVDKPEIALSVLPGEPHELKTGQFWTKTVPRLRKTRFHRWIADAELLAHPRGRLHRRLPEPAELFGNSNGELRPGSPNGSSQRHDTVVLTLAYGNGCWIARNYARRHGLPLLVRFDDWWPDIAAVHQLMRPYLQRKFVELHKSATVSICVSEGMKAALGPHPDAVVVLPIPDANAAIAATAPPSAPPLRVCYLGNMYDYGPMLAGLADRSRAQSDIRIEFRGPEPRWPDTLKQTMRQEGLLHGFADGPEYQKWFESFHAYLVAMFFEPEQRRRVETCFATKLVEYAKLGRPIVLWAPESASVVQWATRTKAALCVTDPNPEALLEALRKLAGNPREQEQLGILARRAYETDFAAERLQNTFLAALRRAPQNHDRQHHHRAS
ncbi:MAG: hypothetical protein C5B50_28250 [Verrucomicrobia bacterium]|nr:MAG: hypothetical protein C5B50_28250 [Verrucomicrobiota bacterium]